MSLKLILGCMYSGKTTKILRIVNSLKHINEIPIVLKPKKDINNKKKTIGISKISKSIFIFFF